MLVVHVPPLHGTVTGHTAHALPPLPHALGAVPARHCPVVEQHPVQDAGSQVLDGVVPVAAAPPEGGSTRALQA